ncbi:hypothetical protein K435DRAFT_691088 [Dendrothele bispora CBS 962.96]|uniref:Phosphoribosyltransferase domain-containing protein n=1 Tax=Dendrothele bispora (strain CBS 962.96) TaxID=1314807 RepID=A0A4S8L3S1_DENBC|nr:hypothetical protein K435DRAFT_691088 [Dendrothele bispora CBS 962.96]
MPGEQDDPTAFPRLFYFNSPSDSGIAFRYVPHLLDPMLVTGSSTTKVVKLLLEEGVKEERFLFINLVEKTRFPPLKASTYSVIVKVITGWVDQELNERTYAVPGLRIAERGGIVR